MSLDLVTRLRRWTHAADAGPASDLMDEAADEMERIRNERNHWVRTAQAFDEHLATMRVMMMEHPTVRFGAVSSCETVRAVTEPLPEEKRAEVSAEPLCRRPQLTLTNEEREAVKSAIWDYEQNDDDADCASMAAILRGLLERLK